MFCFFFNISQWKKKVLGIQFHLAHFFHRPSQRCVLLHDPAAARWSTLLNGPPPPAPPPPPLPLPHPFPVKKACLSVKLAPRWICASSQAEICVLSSIERSVPELMDIAKTANLFWKEGRRWGGGEGRGGKFKTWLDWDCRWTGFRLDRCMGGCNEHVCTVCMYGLWAASKNPIWMSITCVCDIATHTITRCYEGLFHVTKEVYLGNSGLDFHQGAKLTH